MESRKATLHRRALVPSPQPLVPVLRLVGQLIAQSTSRGHSEATWLPGWPAGAAPVSHSQIKAPAYSRGPWTLNTLPRGSSHKV